MVDSAARHGARWTRLVAGLLLPAFLMVTLAWADGPTTLRVQTAPESPARVGLEEVLRGASGRRAAWSRWLLGVGVALALGLTPVRSVAGGQPSAGPFHQSSARMTAAAPARQEFNVHDAARLLQQAPYRHAAAAPSTAPHRRLHTLIALRWNLQWAGYLGPWERPGDLAARTPQQFEEALVAEITPAFARYQQARHVQAGPRVTDREIQRIVQTGRTPFSLEVSRPPAPVTAPAPKPAPAPATGSAGPPPNPQPRAALPPAPAPPAARPAGPPPARQRPPAARPAPAAVRPPPVAPKRQAPATVPTVPPVRPAPVTPPVAQGPPPTKPPAAVQPRLETPIPPAPSPSLPPQASRQLVPPPVPQPVAEYRTALRRFERGYEQRAAALAWVKTGLNRSDLSAEQTKITAEQTKIKADIQAERQRVRRSNRGIPPGTALRIHTLQQRIDRLTQRGNGVISEVVRVRRQYRDFTADSNRRVERYYSQPRSPRDRNAVTILDGQAAALIDKADRFQGRLWTTSQELLNQHDEGVADMALLMAALRDDLASRQPVPPTVPPIKYAVLSLQHVSESVPELREGWDSTDGLRWWDPKFGALAPLTPFPGTTETEYILALPRGTDLHQAAVDIIAKLSVSTEVVIDQLVAGWIPSDPAALVKLIVVFNARYKYPNPEWILVPIARVPALRALGFDMSASGGPVWRPEPPPPDQRPLRPTPLVVTYGLLVLGALTWARVVGWRERRARQQAITDQLIQRFPNAALQRAQALVFDPRSDPDPAHEAGAREVLRWLEEQEIVDDAARAQLAYTVNRLPSRESRDPGELGAAAAAGPQVHGAEDQQEPEASGPQRVAGDEVAGAAPAAGRPDEAAGAGGSPPAAEAAEGVAPREVAQEAEAPVERVEQPVVWVGRVVETVQEKVVRTGLGFEARRRRLITVISSEGDEHASLLQALDDDELKQSVRARKRLRTTEALQRLAEELAARYEVPAEEQRIIRFALGLPERQGSPGLPAVDPLREILVRLDQALLHDVVPATPLPDAPPAVVILPKEALVEGLAMASIPRVHEAYPEAVFAVAGDLTPGEQAELHQLDPALQFLSGITITDQASAETALEVAQTAPWWRPELPARVLAPTDDHNAQPVELAGARILPYLAPDDAHLLSLDILMADTLGDMMPQGSPVLGAILASIPIGALGVEPLVEEVRQRWATAIGA